MQDRPKLAGMRRLVLAFVNSWKGFRGAFRFEAAFRQEVALAVVLLPLGVLAGQDRRSKRPCWSPRCCWC